MRATAGKAPETERILAPRGARRPTGKESQQGADDADSRSRPERMPCCPDAERRGVEASGDDTSAEQGRGREQEVDEGVGGLVVCEPRRSRGETRPEQKRRESRIADLPEVVGVVRVENSIMTLLGMLTVWRYVWVRLHAVPALGLASLLRELAAAEPERAQAPRRTYGSGICGFASTAVHCFIRCITGQRGRSGGYVGAALTRYRLAANVSGAARVTTARTTADGWLRRHSTRSLTMAGTSSPAAAPRSRRLARSAPESATRARMTLIIMGESSPLAASRPTTSAAAARTSICVSATSPASAARSEEARPWPSRTVASLRWSGPPANRAATVDSPYAISGRVNHEVVTNDPKSQNSSATISIEAEVAAALRLHRLAQKEERLKAGPAWEDTGHVFVEADGSPPC